ncbi:MAG: sigma-70 family RNA polymerase sigma factor [Planctomycetia bacterium]|nr:sigma-70 family RNA polymerase sigma factor [Planctomycetia bacterium]
MDTAAPETDVARLVKTYQAGVWRYLRALGCEASTADDLTQETFLTVLEKPFSDFNPAATAAYLRTVARNLFISLQRRANRSISVADLDELDLDWSRWAGDDAGQHLLASLKECLQALGEKAKRAIELRYQEEASRAGIATSLGMSEDGAKNLLQRAKQQLRECVERKQR